jgi:hypothetical protein
MDERLPLHQFLFCFLLISAVFTFGAVRAEAQWSGNSSGHLSFSISKSEQDGCVKVNYIYPSNGFPTLEKGVVTMVHFAYSIVDADSVTEDSSFQETSLSTDESDNIALSTNEFCGFKPERTFFKYALYDANNQLLEFQAPGDFDSYSNTVDLQDPNITHLK